MSKNFFGSWSTTGNVSKSRLYSSRHFSIIYLNILKDYAKERVGPVDSRVGPVRDLGRAVFEMKRDGNRVCLLKGRRFNPFFGLAEASWVLAGLNVLEPLRFFLATIEEYSDDGMTLNGAYGYRMRKALGMDQLEEVIRILKNDPSSRRAIISFWNSRDLGASSKDIPCNTALYFKVRSGRLDVAVCNRSNDLYLGVPYNVLTFTLIQRYIARRINAEVGSQCHFTDSLHVYEANRQAALRIANTNAAEDLRVMLRRCPLADLGNYAAENHESLLRGGHGESERSGLCKRILASYFLWKSGRRKDAIQMVPMSDIGYAAIQWYSNSRFFKSQWLPSWYIDLERSA